MDAIVGDDQCSFVEVCNVLQGTLSFSEKSIELARKLKLPSDVVYKLKTGLARETTSQYDALHEILESWRSKEADNARLLVLIGVLESCDDHEAAEKLRSRFNIPRDLVARNVNKEDLLEKRVNVSGKSLKLKEVFTYAGVRTHADDGLLGEHILLDLKNNKQPNIFENSIPNPISFYVPRHISTRRLLKTDEIFTNSQNDVFAFTGIARHELSKYARGQTTDTSTNQRRMKSTSVKYMVLDMKSDFEELSKTVQGSIHWIEHDGGKFYWVRSSGKMDNIQSAIEMRHVQRKYDEDQLSHVIKRLSSNLPVVISDTPGMGKTLLLANLASKLISEGEIVLFGVMSKVVTALTRKMGGDASLENAVIDVLSSLGGKEGTLANAYLKKALTSDDVHINVMLDGFDEVSSDDRDLASQFLTSIKALPSSRLWVTTRPQMLEEVENCVQVLGFNILPFSRENQRDFLVQFWGQDTRYSKKRLKAFADHSLDKLHESMESEEHTIAGVPLQCMLIGEVLRREATNYADPDNLISEILPSIEIGSISELYKRLVEVKLDKYFKRGDSNRFSREQLLRAHIDLSVKLLFPRLDNNAKVARRGPVQQEDLLNVGLLELVSGEDELAFIHRTIAEFFVSLLAVQLLGGKVQNREFGRLVDNILESDSYEENLIMPSGYRISQSTNRFKHPVIIHFLDSLLGHDPATQLQLPVNVIDLRSLAHSCVNGGHRNMLMYFHNSFNGQARSVFDKDLVLQSVIHSNLEMAKHVCETYEKVNEGDRVRDIRLKQNIRAIIRREEETTVLHVTVRFGVYSVVEYLVNCHGFRELVEGDHPITSTMIHYCVEETYNVDDASAHELIQVVKFLLQLNQGLLEYTNADDETPLLCYSVHKLLLFELVRLGANVLAVDRKHDTVLHKVSYNFSAKDYHELVTRIPREALVKLLQMKGYEDSSALHAILKIKNPDPYTLQRFKDLGSDFNEINDGGRSVLDIAVSNFQSVDVLDQLVLHGADWKRKGNHGWTCLHTTLKKCNFQAFKYFGLKIADDVNKGNWLVRKFFHSTTLDIKSLRKILLDANGWADLDKVDLRVLGTDVNARDYKSSLFEYVVQTKINEEDKYEIAKLLLRSGGIPTTPSMKFNVLKWSRELLTLLETQGAVRSEKDAGNFLKCIGVGMTSREQEAYEELADRLLVKWPLARNKGDSYRNTPLHYASKHRNELGVRYLLRKGAYVNARNWGGETPLHAAIGSSYRDPIDIVRLLEEYGADLAARDIKNRTPLQLAQTNRYTLAQTVQYLISRGA